VNLEVDMIAKYVEQQQLPEIPPTTTEVGHTRGIDAAIAAIAAIRKGGMVIVTDDRERENEGDLVAAADLATTETINFMVTRGRGLVCAPLTRQRALELGIGDMTAENTALHGTAFTISVDATTGTTTGVSAADRAATVRALADPATAARELARPGHIFPIVSHPEGLRARAGHTEAVIELCCLAGRQPVGVLCEIMADDGSMARSSALTALADTHDLPVVSVAEIAAASGTLDQRATS
jgi:3,4-dihydroxy-2-butanone 4-phosphate synthase